MSSRSKSTRARKHPAVSGPSVVQGIPLYSSLENDTCQRDNTEWVKKYPDQTLAEFAYTHDGKDLCLAIETAIASCHLAIEADVAIGLLDTADQRRCCVQILLEAAGFESQIDCPQFYIYSHGGHSTWLKPQLLQYLNDRPEQAKTHDDAACLWFYQKYGSNDSPDFGLLIMAEYANATEDQRIIAAVQYAIQKFFAQGFYAK